MRANMPDGKEGISSVINRSSVNLKTGFPRYYGYEAYQYQRIEK